MNVNSLMALVGGEAVNIADGEREINGGYVGDLLSYVMGKAPADCAWFTVMTNVNVCAVAALADVSVVVLCEGCRPDDVLTARAKEKEINLIITPLDIFEAVVRFGAVGSDNSVRGEK